MLTPGHTPGSLSLRLSCTDKPVYFTGDVCHHPLQMLVPEMNSAYCQQPDVAIALGGPCCRDASKKAHYSTRTLWSAPWLPGSRGRGVVHSSLEGDADDGLTPHRIKKIVQHSKGKPPHHLIIDLEPRKVPCLLNSGKEASVLDVPEYISATSPHSTFCTSWLGASWPGRACNSNT